NPKPWPDADPQSSHVPNQTETIKEKMTFMVLCSRRRESFIRHAEGVSPSHFDLLLGTREVAATSNVALDPPVQCGLADGLHVITRIQVVRNPRVSRWIDLAGDQAPDKSVGNVERRIPGRAMRVIELVGVLLRPFGRFEQDNQLRLRPELRQP